MPQAARYVGTAQSRVDGRAKVTGAAKYAAEFDALTLLTGPSSRAQSPRAGSSRSTPSAALAVPGVLQVFTHETGRGRPGSTSSTGTTSPRPARRGRSMTTGSSTAASRSRWWWPRTSTWRTTRRPSCGSRTRSTHTPPISISLATPPMNRRSGVSASLHCRARAGTRGARSTKPPIGSQRVPDRDRAPQPDGAARLDRHLRGRRQAHHPRQDARSRRTARNTL